MITTDEVFLNDLAGLLSLDGSFTPRLSTPRPVESSNALDALLFTQGLDNASSPRLSDIKSDTNNQRLEKEKNRQRRYRQRLKDSRDELSIQLNELHQTALLRNSSHSTDELFLRSRWMSEVETQRQRRMKSEADKKMLLAAVNSQAEYIKELRQVVAKRMNKGSLLFERDAPTAHSMTSLLYTTYLQHLESCYARVDNVMDECGLTSMPETSITSVHRRKSDGTVAYFQHVSKIQPFSERLKPTGNYCTDKLCQASVEVKWPPDDDVYIKTRFLQRTSTGALAQRCVLRQYKEEKRMVFVWKTASEGGGGFTGLHADETGWVCVEPSETGIVLSICVTASADATLFDSRP